MNNREFDNWLVGKMNELEKAYDNKELVPPEEANWKHISSIINTHQVNSQFDDQLKSTLNNARVLDTNANWEQFQLKLQLVRERRNKIVGTRIAEVLVLLLLFWTLNTVSDPIFNSPMKHPANPIALNNTSYESPSSNNLNQNNFNKNIEHQIDSKEKNARSPFKFSKVSKQRINNASLQLSSRYKLVNFAKKNNLNQLDKSNNGIINSIANSNANQNSENSSSTLNISTNESSNQNRKNNDSQSLDLPIKENEITEINNEKENQSLVELINNDSNSGIISNKLDMVNTTRPVVAENIVKGLMPQKINPTNRVFWLGYSIGLARIQTTNAKFTPDYVNLKTNYQTSSYKNVFVNLDYERWMIQTGVKFFELKLIPGDYIDFGKFDENESIDQISKITYKMIEAPITLHRKLLNTYKWDFGGFAGLSIVICNKAKYEFNRNTKIDRRDIYNDPYNNLTKLNYNFNYGVSIDEVWKGNTYTNFLLGFSGTYKLLDYFHLTSNLSYSSMLEKSGFGPISNSFKNLNLDFGVRYNFQ